MSMELYKQVERLIQQNSLHFSHKTVIIAVSGGADSLVLLQVLNQLKSRIPFMPHVATLDHGLRGDAGKKDAQFVVEIARSMGLSYTQETVDTLAIAQSLKIGIEAAARHARYNFLARVAHSRNAKLICVAHHADDQAETILLHLLRGTGLDGLTGMQVISPLPTDSSLMLMRPLLHVKRAEIEAYCLENNLNPRQDISNSESIYLRNRIRLEVIPYLKQINPQFDQALVQLGHIVNADRLTLDNLLLKEIDGAVQSTSGRVSLALAIFQSLDLSLKRRFIRWSVSQLFDGQPLAEVGFQHIEDALAIIEAGETGSRALLPGGLQVRRGYDALYVESVRLFQQTPSDQLIPLLEAGAIIDVALNGITPLGQGCALITSDTPPPIYAARLAIPAGSELQIRTRQIGDKFSPFGLKGRHQTIKKWLVDHKIPSEVRNFLPLILVDDEIAAIMWGSTWVIDERFSVTDSSENIFYLSLSHENMS